MRPAMRYAHLKAKNKQGGHAKTKPDVQRASLSALLLLLLDLLRLPLNVQDLLLGLSLPLVAL